MQNTAAPRIFDVNRTTAKNAAFEAIFCDTLRDDKSGRRVSNPRPSAWEARPQGRTTILGHDVGRLDERELRRALSVDQDHFARESGAFAFTEFRQMQAFRGRA
jgi:hypothetical protein